MVVAAAALGFREAQGGWRGPLMGMAILGLCAGPQE